MTQVSPDSSFGLETYGALGVLCLILLAALWALWRKYERTDAELKAVLREMSTTVIPLLTQATDALVATPKRLDRALGEVEHSHKEERVEALLSRMDAYVTKLQEQQKPG